MGVRAGALRATGVTARAGDAAGTDAGAGAGAAGVVIVTVEGEEKKWGWIVTLRLCPRPQPQPRFRCLQLQHCPQHCLWHLQVPASQISSSGFSSLEDQMRGRLPSYRGSATQQRVQKSIGLIRRALANRYVLIPNAAFNLMVYPG